MPTFKITASYKTFCSVTIEAEHMIEAQKIAGGMDGCLFAERDSDDWQIERVEEVVA